MGNPRHAQGDGHGSADRHGPGRARPCAFSACHGLRVGEAASIRRADVSQPGWVSFYDRKTKRRWIRARLGTWAERWRQALLACAIVQRRADFLPLFSEAELERRMHCLLWGTPWVGVGLHCWRRPLAAAMVALGAPITAVCVWNRWASQRQAWEYAVPGPDSEFELPDQARWPHPVAGVTTLPLSSVQFWPAGALGRHTTPDASSTPIIIMVDSDDEGDDTDDGVLGAPGTHRGMAQRGRERRARHQGGQQQATPAPRACTTPPAQAKARRFSSDATSVAHAQRGTARPSSGNPQATPPPSPPQEQARDSWSPPLSACQRCGKRVSEHLLDAAVLTEIKGSVDHRRADSLLRMWWAEAHRWALDRPAVSPDDEALLHDTLHHLATHDLPDEAPVPAAWRWRRGHH